MGNFVSASPEDKESLSDLNDVLKWKPWHIVVEENPKELKRRYRYKLMKIKHGKHGVKW